MRRHLALLFSDLEELFKLLSQHPEISDPGTTKKSGREIRKVGELERDKKECESEKVHQVRRKKICKKMHFCIFTLPFSLITYHPPLLSKQERIDADQRRRGI